MDERIIVPRPTFPKLLAQSAALEPTFYNVQNVNGLKKKYQKKIM